MPKYLQDDKPWEHDKAKSLGKLEGSSASTMLYADGRTTANMPMDEYKRLRDAANGRLPLTDPTDKLIWELIDNEHWLSDSEIGRRLPNGGLSRSRVSERRHRIIAAGYPAQKTLRPKVSRQKR